jgi:hypothetical protein
VARRNRKLLGPSEKREQAPALHVHSKSLRTCPFGRGEDWTLPSRLPELFGPSLGAVLGIGGRGLFFDHAEEKGAAPLSQAYVEQREPILEGL